MRQDKCFELRKAQLRWNRLPALTSSHSGQPENWATAYPVSAAENQGLQRLADKFACLEKPATSTASQGVKEMSAFPDIGGKRHGVVQVQANVPLCLCLSLPPANW
jgi:hypothetical protein